MTIFMIEVGKFDYLHRLTGGDVDVELGYFTTRADAQARIDQLTDRTADYEKYLASLHKVTPEEVERYESYLAQKAAIEAAGLTPTIRAVRKPKDAAPDSYEKWLSKRQYDQDYDLVEVLPGAVPASARTVLAV